jgi:hypothetical protein
MANEKEVVSFMEKYFGPVAKPLLHRTMEGLGYKSITRLSENDRFRLCETMIHDLFASIMSTPKLRIIRSKLFSLLDIDQSRLQEEQYVDYSNY